MYIYIHILYIYIYIYIHIYIYIYIDLSHCWEARHCHEVSFSASIAGALWFSDACAIGSSIKMDASVSAGGGTGGGAVAVQDAGESVKT